MLKRMASKITAHVGMHHKAEQINLPSPPASTDSHMQYDHRGSISTDRTSASQEQEYREEVVTTTRKRTPQRPKGTYRLSDFIIQRTLGTGSFGRVHLGTWNENTRGPLLNNHAVRSKHNLRFYAIKVLNKDRIAKMKQIEHTNNEQQMLASVQHPFIINLWGVFQDSGNLYMVMDFVPGGELFTLLRRSNVLPTPIYIVLF